MTGDATFGEPEYFTEWYGKYEAHSHRRKRVFTVRRTGYQSVELAALGRLGKVLLLDGRVQSAECDQRIYHESLVWPAAARVVRPTRALVLGAGEGVVMAELLRLHSLRRIVAVDIDAEIIEISKKSLRDWNRGSFEDPRVDLRIEDGRAYVEKYSGEPFDLAYLDLPEPLAGGPARSLYTVEFYRAVRRCLKPGGIAVIQANAVRINFYDWHFRILKSLECAFPHVLPYVAYIPSFSMAWGFAMASSRPIRPLRRASLDRLLRQTGHDLVHYSFATDGAMCAAPPWYEKLHRKGKWKPFRDAAPPAERVRNLARRPTPP